LAVLFFLGGAFLGWNPFLIFIAIFIWFSAGGEARMVEARAAFSGLTIDRVMITHFQTVSPGDSLAAVVAQILAGFQHDFPVVEDGRVVGLLPREDLIAALKQRGDETPVAAVMQRAFVSAHPREPVEAAFARLQPGLPTTLLVINAGRLAGIVTPENVNEYLAIRGSLRRPAPPPLPPR